jgi:hypothetical protein
MLFLFLLELGFLLASLERVTSSVSIALEKRTSLLESLLSSYPSLLRPSLRGFLMLEYRGPHVAFLLFACSILTVSIAPYYRGASGY